MNNMAETFNGYIINARTKHIMSMLEDIRTTVIQRLYLKKGQVNKWKYVYSPCVIARLEKKKEHARSCDSIPRHPQYFLCTDSLGDVLI